MGRLDGGTAGTDIPLRVKRGFVWDLPLEAEETVLEVTPDDTIESLPDVFRANLPPTHPVCVCAVYVRVYVSGWVGVGYISLHSCYRVQVSPTSPLLSHSAISTE